MEKLADHEAIARDPDLFLRLNPNHVAIDESQSRPSGPRVATTTIANHAGASSSPDRVRPTRSPPAAGIKGRFSQACAALPCWQRGGPRRTTWRMFLRA
ncbi:MAG: hypothetical protein IPH41_06805 [Sulfuritalea sp.]|nr:hypothetical protein [Sulfuritalea sp.]